MSMNFCTISSRLSFIPFFTGIFVVACHAFAAAVVTLWPVSTVQPFIPYKAILSLLPIILLLYDIRYYSFFSVSIRVSISLSISVFSAVLITQTVCCAQRHIDDDDRYQYTCTCSLVQCTLSYTQSPSRASVRTDSLDRICERKQKLVFSVENSGNVERAAAAAATKNVSFYGLVLCFWS